MLQHHTLVMRQENNNQNKKRDGSRLEKCELDQKKGQCKPHISLLLNSNLHRLTVIEETQNNKANPEQGWWKENRLFEERDAGSIWTGSFLLLQIGCPQPAGNMLLNLLRGRKTEKQLQLSRDPCLHLVCDATAQEGSLVVLKDVFLNNCAFQNSLHSL